MTYSDSSSDGADRKARPRKVQKKSEAREHSDLSGELDQKTKKLNFSRDQSSRGTSGRSQKRKASGAEAGTSASNVNAKVNGTPPKSTMKTAHAAEGSSKLPSSREAAPTSATPSHYSRPRKYYPGTPTSSQFSCSGASTYDSSRPSSSPYAKMLPTFNMVYRSGTEATNHLHLKLKKHDARAKALRESSKKSSSSKLPQDDDSKFATKKHSKALASTGDDGGRKVKSKERGQSESSQRTQPRSRRAPDFQDESKMKRNSSPPGKHPLDDGVKSSRKKYPKIQHDAAGAASSDNPAESKDGTHPRRRRRHPDVPKMTGESATKPTSTKRPNKIQDGDSSQNPGDPGQPRDLRMNSTRNHPDPLDAASSSPRKGRFGKLLPSQAGTESGTGARSLPVQDAFSILASQIQNLSLSYEEVRRQTGRQDTAYSYSTMNDGVATPYTNFDMVRDWVLASKGQQGNSASDVVHVKEPSTGNEGQPTTIKVDAAADVTPKSNSAELAKPGNHSKGNQPPRQGKTGSSKVATAEKDKPIHPRVELALMSLPNIVDDDSAPAPKGFPGQLADDGERWRRCPYDSGHTFLRPMVHLLNCRERYLTECRRLGKPVEIEVCCYNYEHHIPLDQLEDHQNRCKDGSMLHTYLLQWMKDQRIKQRMAQSSAYAHREY